MHILSIYYLLAGHRWVKLLTNNTHRLLKDHAWNHYQVPVYHKMHVKLPTDLPI